MTLPKTEKAKVRKCLSFAKSAADGLDIALFGRMVAQDAALNVQAAASFAHALSTHRVVNEVEFFTALDDYARLIREDEDQVSGSSHMGTLEYNAATYYRYISLDLGQLWENTGGDGMDRAVEGFVRALYMAVPAARQSTQSGACPWDYARILVRRGQRMQLSFEKPVRSAADGGWLTASRRWTRASPVRNSLPAPCTARLPRPPTAGKTAAASTTSAPSCGTAWPA